LGPVAASTLLDTGVSFTERSFPICKRNQRYHKQVTSNWQLVEQAYQLVQIPRTCEDIRIVEYVGGASFVLQGYNPTPPKGAMRRFATFCADYGLLSLLENRRAFYQKEAKNGARGKSESSR
jgi:hypothetical protein